MIYSIMERENFILSNGFHTENILMIVLEGSFELILSSERYFAEENTVLFFEKGKRFERHILSPIKIIYIILDHDCKIDTGILNFTDNSRKNSTIRFLKNAIIAHNTKNVRHFCTDLITQYSAENHVKNDEFSDEVLEFFDYVALNHRSKMKIEDFSKAIFMSHTGFLLKFKKEVGMTPSEYITDFRLEKSVDLLINTNFSVSRIAEEVGYENLYYFSNAFKKKYNMSPLKFRKNQI